MMNAARRRTLYLWIALLAILFGSIAPTISRALDPRAQFAPGSICLTDQGGGRPASDPSAMQSCAYCLPHSTSQVTLPPAPYSVAIIGGHDRYESPEVVAPRLHRLALHSNARAPPVLA